MINDKRVHRLYVEERLQRKLRRRKAATRSAPLTIWTRPNEPWAMAFMHDVLQNGRAIRVFTIVDGCTRECVALHAVVGSRAVTWRRSSPRLAHSAVVYLRLCKATTLYHGSQGTRGAK